MFLLWRGQLGLIAKHTWQKNTRLNDKVNSMFLITIRQTINFEKKISFYKVLHLIQLERLAWLNVCLVCWDRIILYVRE